MPEIPYGSLVDHISRYFGGGRKMFGRLGELEHLEHKIISELQYEGIEDQVTHLRMRFDKLPRAIRETIHAERMGLTGIGEALEDPVLRGTFRTVKEASLHETGWGFFDIPSHYYLDAASAGDVDRVASLLTYSTLNPQVHLSGELAAPASFIRQEGLRHTAQQLVDMDTIRSSSRLIFDVETTGLTKRDEIWQLSARLMRGDQTLDSITLHIPTDRMNLGLYKHGDQYMTFQDFYNALRQEQGRAPAQWTDDIGQELTRLFRMADDAEYLVAHNAPFDVAQIERLITRMGGDLPEGFSEGADALVRKMKSGRMIDTSTLARVLIDDIGLPDDFVRPFALENIVQQTDLVESLIQKHGAEEVRAKLVHVGAHDADVDTWLTNEFLNNLLDRRPLAERPGGLGDNVFETADAIRKQIKERSASAITPTATQMLEGMTPLELLARETRRFGTTPFSVPEATMEHVGMFDEWTRSIITERGDVRFGTGLLDDFAHIPGVQEATDTLQARAVRAGLPFAGLSAPERLLSTVIGQHVSRWAPSELNRARTLMGDLTGGGLVRATETARVFGSDKNVALTMDLIMQAEKEGALHTRFHKALAGDDVVQTARWSPFTWGERQQRDVALVADAFENAADADEFMRWLEKNYQNFDISDNVMASIRRAHKARNLERYGIQLGIMGGRGERSVEMVANLMEQLGYGRDQGGPGLRTPVFRSKEGFIHTAATFIGGIGDVPEEEMLRQVRSTARLTDHMVDQAGSAAGFAGAAWQRARGQAGSGMPIFRFLTKHLPNVRGRHIGVGTAALAGYYIFKGRREQAPFDESLEDQGFEDPNFYERYRRDMGLRSTERHRIRPLDTAGMTNYLDRTKTRHHQMGPDKHSHLYGG